MEAEGRGAMEHLGKLKRSVSITQALDVVEWEVVMDRSRLPLSRKKGTKGTSLDGLAMSELQLY